MLIVGYQGAYCSTIECVLYPDGYVFLSYGLDGGSINYFSPLVTHFLCLLICHLPDYSGVWVFLWVSSHESVDVGPYFEAVGIKCACHDCRGVVTSSSPQIGDASTITVAGDEPAHYRHFALELA